jgi:PKD repeat protein
LALTVNLPTPVITSPGTASGIKGQAFSYQITATNSPTSFGAGPLPAGLTVSTMTGLISGIPTSTGSTSVGLSARNAAGTGTKTLTLTVNLPTPVITSPGTASGIKGQAFSYQITATNSPTSFGAGPLPAGLTVSTMTGLISGIPTSTGTTNVTLQATNAAGTGRKTLALTINLPGVPAAMPGSGTTSIMQPSSLMAATPVSVRVYPNPWRRDHHEGKNITFDQVPAGSTLRLFSVSGRLVRTLNNSGGGVVTWNLTNDGGDAVASGLYVYLIKTKDGSTRGKLAIIR